MARFAEGLLGLGFRVEGLGFRAMKAAGKQHALAWDVLLRGLGLRRKGMSRGSGSMLHAQP